MPSVEGGRYQYITEWVVSDAVVATSTTTLDPESGITGQLDNTEIEAIQTADQVYNLWYITS